MSHDHQRHRHSHKHGDRDGYRQHHHHDRDEDGRHRSTTPRNTLRIEGSNHHHSRQNSDSTPRDLLMLESADRYNSQQGCSSDSPGEIIVEERDDEYDLADYGYGEMSKDDWDSVVRVLYNFAESKRQPAIGEQAERRRDEEWNKNKNAKEVTARYMRKVIKEVFEDSNRYGLQDDIKGGICSNIANDVAELHHAKFDFGSKMTDKEKAFVGLLVGCLDRKINDEETDERVKKRCKAKKTEIQGMFV